MEKKSWIIEYWRPVFCWVYIVICASDFFLFPIFNTLILAYLHYPITQYIPVTTANGGIFHIAAGAIIGTTTWTKGMAEVENIKNSPDFSDCGQQILEQNQGNINVNIDSTIIKKRGIPRGPAGTGQ